MNRKASSVPPVAIVPPSRAPTPCAAPSGKTKSKHGTSSATSHKSNSKSEQRTHVHFESQPTKSRALIPATPTFTSNNAVVNTTPQQYPNASFQTTTIGAPGQICIKGGWHSHDDRDEAQGSRWHTYEANIPTADLANVNPAHQANLINALIASQAGNFNEQTTNKHNESRTNTRITEVNNTNLIKATQSQGQALTAKTLQSLVPTSNALTSISRRPSPKNIYPRDHEVSERRLSTFISPSYMTYPTSTPNASHNHNHDSEIVRCHRCGEAKKPNVQNVRELLCVGRVQVCWRCLAEMDPEGAVRAWFNGGA